MTDESGPTKGETLAAIERERAAWENLLAEVGEDRMLEPGPMGDWTFKDLVAHLTTTSSISMWNTSRLFAAGSRAGPSGVYFARALPSATAFSRSSSDSTRLSGSAALPLPGVKRNPSIYGVGFLRR